MAFCIITINANGLRDSNKRAGLLQYLRSFPSVVDVVCFQECHCSSENDSQMWFRSSGFSSVVSPGSVKSCCSIILLSFVNLWSDSDGHFLLAEISFSDSVFRICSVYAPKRNPARDQFFDNLIP